MWLYYPKCTMQIYNFVCFILQLRKLGKLPLDKKQKLGMPELHALYFPNAKFEGN